MMCYRDMTFCSSDCTNTKCGRLWTEYHKKQARRWWSHDPNNAPVAFSDFSGRCEYYTVKTEGEKR